MIRSRLVCMGEVLGPLSETTACEFLECQPLPFAAFPLNYCLVCTPPYIRAAGFSGADPMRSSFPFNHPWKEKMCAKGSTCEPCPRGPPRVLRDCFPSWLRFLTFLPYHLLSPHLPTRRAATITVNYSLPPASPSPDGATRSDSLDSRVFNFSTISTSGHSHLAKTQSPVLPLNMYIGLPKFGM